MKQDMDLTANIPALRKQLDSLIPSSDAVRVLDAILRLLGTTRWRIGAEIGTDGTAVLWAFERGKSKRAEQVRRLTLKGVDALLEKEKVAA